MVMKKRLSYLTSIGMIEDGKERLTKLKEREREREEEGEREGGREKREEKGMEK